MLVLLCFCYFAPSNQLFGSEYVEVKGRRVSWLESTQTASEGLVEKEQLKERPILRPGEILESVPGLITTQHSGTGKANQYFLRGFNLDHGTDFATSVDGIPINMPSHGHGQGYTDVNFLVPEILEDLEYSKGPYRAKIGDFSGAGHIDLRTQDTFAHGLLKFTAGSYGYQRALLLDSVPMTDADHFNYVLESTQYQGPWSDLSEDLHKTFGLVKFIHKGQDSKTSLTLLRYEARWNSADQIPQRAVQDGILDRLGSIDRSNAGKTQRDSASLQWEKATGQGTMKVLTYAVNYGLNLWSNSSYFLEDPVNGDQREQEDRRSIYGADLSYSQKFSLASVPAQMTLGLQERYDQIHRIGLYKTVQRSRIAELTNSAVNEFQTGFYVEQELFWTQDFHSLFGLRHDRFSFENRDKILSAKAQKVAQLTSPKLSLSYRILQGWQVFANAGQSFHSNDARGVTSQEIAPSSTPGAPGLVPVRGYELGNSYEWKDLLRISLAVWRLQLESELVYVGDAGTTEAARGSRREGVDWLVQLAPDQNFHADLELSWAKAVYNSDVDGEGIQVEGHLPFVAMLGLGSQMSRQWSLSGRLRHFGKRPLTANGSVQSQPTSLVNFRVAYEPDAWEFSLDAINVLQSRDHDIDYFYESKLQDEAEPRADLHFHPVEPISFRLNVARRF